MRVALAVVLGALFGMFGGRAAELVLSPFIDSGTHVLSWELTTAVSAIPAIPTLAVAAVGALTYALALPALCACVAETPYAGKSARTSAVLVLTTTAVGGLAAPGGDGAAYLGSALVIAALLALAPGDWAATPLALWFAAVAARWADDVVHGGQWVRTAARSLTEVAHASEGLWTIALGVPSVGLLVLAGALLSRGAVRRST